MKFSSHLRWCIILTMIFTVAAYFLGEDTTMPALPIFIADIIKIFISISACWIIFTKIINRRLKREGSFLQYLLTLLLGIALSVLFLGILELFVAKDELRLNILKEPKFTSILIFVSRISFVSLTCLTTAYSVITSHALHQTRLENEQLQRAQLGARLSSLQQQISPHFLFNSLSTLKSMVDDREAKEYIVKLSACYRYLLSNVSQKLVTLQEEVNFANSFLYVLKERFEEALLVDIDISDQHLKRSIPPFSLQLLLENAVKHNIVTEVYPLNISIKSSDEVLTIKNNFQPKNSTDESTGAGLNNIIERYKLLTDKIVMIEHNDQYFSVTLPLV